MALYCCLYPVLSFVPLTAQGVIATRFFVNKSGIILGMGSTNERRRNKVTSSLIGWPHCQNEPFIYRHYTAWTSYKEKWKHTHYDVIKWKHFPRYWPFVGEGGSWPATGEFPSQRPVTRRFDVFFDLRLNRRLSKQSRPRWFETQSRSLWRHYNAYLRHEYKFNSSHPHLFQNGVFIMNLFDWYSAGFSLLAVSFLECIAVSWIYGKYRKISNIRRTKSSNFKMFLVSHCSCLCAIYWSQVWSREWGCSWSSADRRCSNYVWVIDNLIAL